MDEIYTDKDNDLGRPHRVKEVGFKKFMQMDSSTELGKLLQREFDLLRGPGGRHDQ